MRDGGTPLQGARGTARCQKGDDNSLHGVKGNGLPFWKSPVVDAAHMIMFDLYFFCFWSTVATQVWRQQQ